MCITWFLQNYLKKIISKIFLGRSHMGTLIGAKTCGTPFKWHPGYVPYLPYPRYATDQKYGGIQLSLTCQDIYLDNLN